MSSWFPVLNCPESDSERLGGSISPSVADHSSSASKGKHRFPLVAIVIEAGRLSDSLEDKNGVSEIGISGSLGPATRAGVQLFGLFLSPNLITLARRCREATVLANGRSAIRVALTRFA